MLGPFFYTPSRVGTFFYSLSHGFKGRRHLSSRNDFNRQRLEAARVAKLSQQLSDG
jgi:hypothetical protein